MYTPFTSSEIVKSPVYIKVGIFFWVLGFAVLATSKLHYPYEHHKLYGKELGDITYYVGEHLGRFLLMLGAVSLTFMLERYNYECRTTMYAKNTGLVIAGIMFCRMIGEALTGADILKFEWLSYVVVLAIGIARTLSWLIKHRFKTHGTKP